MTDVSKLLSKIKNGTKNVRPAELRKLMRLSGFNETTTRHTFFFSHSRYIEIRASMAKHKESGQENKVFEKYVKCCLNAIEELLLQEEKK